VKIKPPINRKWPATWLQYRVFFDEIDTCINNKHCCGAKNNIASTTIRPARATATTSKATATSKNKDYFLVEFKSNSVNDKRERQMVFNAQNRNKFVEFYC